MFLLIPACASNVYACVSGRACVCVPGGHLLSCLGIFLQTIKFNSKAVFLRIFSARQTTPVSCRKQTSQSPQPDLRPSFLPPFFFHFNHPTNIYSNNPLSSPLPHTPSQTLTTSHHTLQQLTAILFNDSVVRTNK